MKTILQNAIENIDNDNFGSYSLLKMHHQTKEFLFTQGKSNDEIDAKIKQLQIEILLEDGIFELMDFYKNSDLNLW